MSDVFPKGFVKTLGRETPGGVERGIVSFGPTPRDERGRGRPEDNRDGLKICHEDKRELQGLVGISNNDKKL